MSALPLVIMAAGTAMKMIGDIREGRQLSAGEKYNAAVAEANIKALRTSAGFESESLTQQSEFEQQKISRAKEKLQATQRAAYAKAGVRLDVGSPLEVQADSAAQFELDLAANRYNLQMGLEQIRYGADVQSAQLTAEAAHKRRLAKSYKTAGYLKAGSTFLTGGYGVASNWPSSDSGSKS